jgi:hypothetical protein
VRAVWLVLRTELRHGWRSVVLVAVVSGLGAGFALTAAVGAQRASTAWPRLQAATLAPDVFFSGPPDSDLALVEKVGRLPEVDAFGNFSYTPIAPAGLKPGENAGSFIALDPSFGVDIYRPLIVSGRHADPRRADEITINEDMAKLGHLRSGQRVKLNFGFSPDVHHLAEVTIVGVHRGEFDLGVNAGNATALLPYGFYEKFQDRLEIGPQPGGLVRLRAGAADAPRFQRSLQRIYGADAFFASSTAELGGGITSAINVQKIGLGLLAAAAGLAVAVAGGQATRRVLGARRDDAPALIAMGMRRSQLAVAGALLAGLMAAGVTAVALATGVLASPLVPTGLPGRADPDFGIRVEGRVLALGGALILVMLVAVGLYAGWRDSRGVDRTHRPRRGLPSKGPILVALGGHWALAPRSGPASASARSALAAVAAGMVGVVSVLTFAASLDHLLATDRLHGWDFQGGYNDGEYQDEDLSGLVARFPKLTRDPDIDGLAVGSIVDLRIDGAVSEAYALDPLKGRPVHPTLLEGRAPVAGDEIVAGSGSLRAVHKGVGDVVTGGDETRRMRIVGKAVFPEMGNNGDLSHMAWITQSALPGLGSQRVQAMILVRVRPGASAEAVIKRNTVENVEPITAFQPSAIKNIKQVGAIPWVLSGFLALLGLAAVGHALVTSVRHRRGEIAVLRSFGMVRRQVRLSVASQATITVLAGSLIGVPLGIAAGRWAWSLVATGLGVVYEPVVAALLVAAAVPVGLILANVLAAGPAAVAARLRPAQVLRTE